MSRERGANNKPVLSATFGGMPSLWLPVSILGGLLLLSLVIQLTLAWLSYDRVRPVDRHVGHLEKLQQLLTDVERNLTLQLPGNRELTVTVRNRLKTDIQAIIDRQEFIAEATQDNLIQAQRLLDDTQREPRQLLLDLLRVLRDSFRAEAFAHKELTHSIYESALFEVELGVVTLIGVPVGALMLMLLMRRRIFLPLHQMGLLMRSLADRQYQQIPLQQVDPMLKNLLGNYNHMVVRLAELEHEHMLSERKLASQVEQAVRTLIEQQKSLADTERLAALGEVTARMAHELRNPLAGVRMACSNLQAELKDGSGDSDDYVQRIAMVGDELDRIVHLLNSLLDRARHKPEELRSVNVATLVNDLLILARYQVPAHIELTSDVPSDIDCRLPDTRLRQALLNLIINAQQAMTETAGCIRVSAKSEDDSLLLSVCDDGPGFPDDMLSGNIQAFNTLRDGGTGLGLSMVQRFVRSQGGQLSLQNRQPRGACVTIQLNCVK